MKACKLRAAKPFTKWLDVKAEETRLSKANPSTNNHIVA